MNTASNWNHDESSRTRQHEEFLELCALSSSGQLTEAEDENLRSHLSVCPSCCEMMRQFETIVEEVLPVIASECRQDNLQSNSWWSEDQAEAALFKRLEQQERSDAGRNEQIGELGFKEDIPSFPIPSTWRHIWTLYAASIVLSIALALSLYQLGLHRGAKLSRSSSRTDATSVLADRQLSDGKDHEREPTRAQVEERNRVIANLRRDLQRQALDLSRLKLAQRRLETDLHNAESAREDLFQERAVLARKAEAAESQLRAAQTTLESMEKQASQDVAGAVALQIKVNDLAQSLQSRDKTIEEKDELLSHDRDIRELMGARDLYIAEVYDIASTGTQKPFGRIFYTKGKSLIFYAYDLDQQTRATKASTFQAWGVKGTDRQNALSLGIFYEDNASKKRWVLRSTSAAVLDKLDAVFVTVEQHGGSHKPSGKPLMFAYLRIAANHP